MDKTEELEKRIEVLERAILKHAEMINDLAHLGAEDAKHLNDHLKEESDYLDRMTEVLDGIVNSLYKITGIPIPKEPMA
jgi:uncharacterized coiled-coil protein SlyX